MMKWNIVDAKSFYNAIFLNFCHPINKSVWPVRELLTPWGGDEEILFVCWVWSVTFLILVWKLTLSFCHSAYIFLAIPPPDAVAFAVSATIHQLITSM